MDFYVPSSSNGNVDFSSNYNFGGGGGADYGGGATGGW